MGYTTGEFSINFGWNSQKLDELNENMSEKYRKEINRNLQLDFSVDKWKTGWTMVPLSKLDKEHFALFENISNKFAEEIKGIVAVEIAQQTHEL